MFYERSSNFNSLPFFQSSPNVLKNPAINDNLTIGMFGSSNPCDNGPKSLPYTLGKENIFDSNLYRFQVGNSSERSSKGGSKNESRRSSLKFDLYIGVESVKYKPTETQHWPDAKRMKTEDNNSNNSMENHSARKCLECVSGCSSGSSNNSGNSLCNLLFPIHSIFTKGPEFDINGRINWEYVVDGVWIHECL